RPYPFYRVQPETWFCRNRRGSHTLSPGTSHTFAGRHPSAPLAVLRTGCSVDRAPDSCPCASLPRKPPHQRLVSVGRLLTRRRHFPYAIVQPTPPWHADPLEP